MGSWPSAAELTHLAFDATSQHEFRYEVMQRLMACTRSDFVIFADAISPIRACDLINFDAAESERARQTVLASPAALQRGNRCLRARGVMVDTLIYTPREWERLPHIAQHQAAMGVTSNLILSWLDRREVPVVLNLAKAGGRYDERDEQHARRLVKSLAVADAWPDRRPDLQPLSLPGLTDRQQEILDYVALGYSNPEIARACGISKFTVRNQLVRLFARFGVATRTQLAQLATRPR